MSAQVPVFDLAFGVVWERRLAGKVDLSIGCHYAFQHWMNALYTQKYVDDVDEHLTTEKEEDLSLHGPSFTISLRW